MSIFVIFDKGLDYNDETHEIGGEGAEVQRQGYATLEQATLALREQLKKQVGNFSINDFGWDGNYDYPVASQWLRDITGDDHHYCRYSYGDQPGCMERHNWSAFITYCEANNIEWLDKVPQLLCIQEITV